MLCDYDVFDVAEIIEMMTNPQELKERIQEAYELIESEE